MCWVSCMQSMHNTCTCMDSPMHAHVESVQGTQKIATRTELTAVRYLEAKVMREATLSTVTDCQMRRSHSRFSSFSQYESASSSSPACV